MRHLEEDKAMSVIKKLHSKGWAGFSLLELMVVVAILGVLATVAVPRFNIFRTRARQGEAKLNLGTIYNLQETFKIEHEQYYNGNNANWGGDPMHTKATRQGYRGKTGGSGVWSCDNNKLGFRLANCNTSRYGYYITGADETEFLAVAYGASDVIGDTRVYPGCEGGTTAVDITTNRVSNVQDPCDESFNANTSWSSGDAWCGDQQRHLENYRDIVEFCQD